jgi:hypothetical protein
MSAKESQAATKEATTKMKKRKMVRVDDLKIIVLSSVIVFEILDLIRPFCSVSFSNEVDYCIFCLFRSY